MRQPVRCIEVASESHARSEMDLIGVDPAGAAIMAPKQLHYNLRLEGLRPAEANILKQEALSVGGEAAVARGAASCSIDTTGALVSGTLRQLKALAGKLKVQCMGLPEAGAAIEEALGNYASGGSVIEGRGRSLAAGGRTLIMGILNVTPDSFSDGGAYVSMETAVERALEMREEGADVIDVGGESTRPGAAAVSAEEEMKRVLPVVEALSAKGLAVSIDTAKAAVARAALDAGAWMVNDVSALEADPEMAGVAAAYGAPVVLMHMRGNPRTMQLDTAYRDLAGEVFAYLASRIEYARGRGIDPNRIIIDPGLGFGKSAEGNLELIRRMRELKSLGRPVLAGPSRKSFVGRFTGGAGVGGRLPGTLAACVASIMNGADILRVHDVKEAAQAAAMADAITGRRTDA